jgi:hypothetical protein
MSTVSGPVAGPHQQVGGERPIGDCPRARTSYPAAVPTISALTSRNWMPRLGREAFTSIRGRAAVPVTDTANGP